MNVSTADGAAEGVGEVVTVPPRASYQPRALVVHDPEVLAEILAQRRRTGADRWDEVWDGVYMMNALPNNEHQDLVADLTTILRLTIDWTGQGKVYPGVNLTDRLEGWEDDFRGPDVVVFLRGGAAEDRGTHWRGAADFLVEVVSPFDQSREKLPFYDRLGVREVLLVDRYPWRLELYGRPAGQLVPLGIGEPGAPPLASQVLPLSFRLQAAEPRPKTEVVHAQSGQRWLV